MSLSDKEKLNALNEVRILASIRHPNMIAYKEAFLDEASNSLWYLLNVHFLILSIVMEYADNGDLFQKIVEHQKKGTLFPEPEIWNIFIQVIQ
jgi:Protein kinase domain.